MVYDRYIQEFFYSKRKIHWKYLCLSPTSFPKYMEYKYEKLYSPTTICYEGIPLIDNEQYPMERFNVTDEPDTIAN